MRLLVSVRSPAEVAPALAGGAEIIDAKEPALGSLGPVSRGTLRAIVELLPGDVPFSVALGEPTIPPEVTRAIRRLEGLPPRSAESYVKLGLAGGGDPQELIRTAIATASSSPWRPRVVLVAYADWSAAGSPSPPEVTRLAAQARVHGVLLDTHQKDGRDLLAHMSPVDVGAWAKGARERGMLVAIAGSLTTTSIARLRGVPAQVVGVRGAACDAGRTGLISEARVRELRRALSRPETAAAFT